MPCGFCEQATSDVVIDGGLPWGSTGKVHPSCLASALAERDRRVCISTPYVGRDWAYAWSNQPDAHGRAIDRADPDPAQYVNGRFAEPIWVRYAEDES